MSDGSVMHLGASAADLGGATLAIVPGDPARVARIAETCISATEERAVAVVVDAARRLFQQKSHRGAP